MSTSSRIHTASPSADVTRAFPLDRHGKALTVGAKVRYVGSIAHMHGAVGEIVFLVERPEQDGRSSRPLVFARVIAPDLAEAVAAGMCVPTEADYQTLNYAHAASFIRIDG